jgi:hypothetical protein
MNDDRESNSGLVSWFYNYSVRCVGQKPPFFLCLSFPSRTTDHDLSFPDPTATGVCLMLTATYQNAGELQRLLLHKADVIAPGTAAATGEGKGGGGGRGG